MTKTETTPSERAMKAALKELLYRLPSYVPCDCFHHRNRDQHGIGDDCPPRKRYDDAVEKARNALEAK